MKQKSPQKFPASRRTDKEQVGNNYTVQLVGEGQEDEDGKPQGLFSALLKNG